MELLGKLISFILPLQIRNLFYIIEFEIIQYKVDFLDKKRSEIVVFYRMLKYICNRFKEMFLYGIENLGEVPER